MDEATMQLEGDHRIETIGWPTESVKAGWPDRVPAREPASADKARRRSLLEGRGYLTLRVLVDFAAVAVAVAVALVAPWREASLPAGHEALIALPAFAIFLLYIRGQYRQQLRPVLLDELGAVASAVSISAMALISVAVVSGVSGGASIVAPAWGFGLALAGSGRVLLTALQRRQRMTRRERRSALIVGTGLIGAHIARRLDERPEYGLAPIGFLDWDPSTTLSTDDQIPPLLGTPDELSDVIKAHNVSHVILGFTYDSDSRLLPLVRECQRLGVEVSVVPRLFDAYSQHSTLEHLGGLPLISLRGPDPRGWEFAGKHIIDRVSAVLLIMLLAPVLIAIAIGVKLSSSGPVLFPQRRVGRNGQLFDLLKFRSMRPDPVGAEFTPEAGSAPGGIEGVDRRTAFGRWLRRSSLDELPQLFNVLKGEMSLIGPRPERPEFVDLFRRDIERYGERHRVKSGITGWAQVHGLRGRTSIADRVEWDNYYIENWSLKLDLRIAALTVKTLLLGIREE